MIYPALTYLSEIGHAGVEQDGSRKLYRITAEGRSYLASNRPIAQAILDALSRIGGRIDECGSETDFKTEHRGRVGKGFIARGPESPVYPGLGRPKDFLLQE